jgi:hypothetical protein
MLPTALSDLAGNAVQPIALDIVDRAACAMDPILYGFLVAGILFAIVLMRTLPHLINNTPIVNFQRRLLAISAALLWVAAIIFVKATYANDASYIKCVSVQDSTVCIDADPWGMFVLGFLVVVIGYFIVDYVNRRRTACKG